MLPIVAEFSLRPLIVIMLHADGHHSANEKQLSNVFQIGKMLARIAVHLKHFLEGRHGSQKDRQVADRVIDLWAPLAAHGRPSCFGQIIRIAVDVGGQDSEGEEGNEKKVEK